MAYLGDKSTKYRSWKFTQIVIIALPQYDRPSDIILQGNIGNIGNPKVYELQRDFKPQSRSRIWY